MTQREFAETHGVREDTLSRWLSPKRQVSPESSGTFIELPTSKGSVVELRFPDGVCFRFAHNAFRRNPGTYTGLRAPGRYEKDAFFLLFFWIDFAGHVLAEGVLSFFSGQGALDQRRIKPGNFRLELVTPDAHNLSGYTREAQRLLADSKKSHTFVLDPNAWMVAFGITTKEEHDRYNQRLIERVRTVEEREQK